MTRRFVHHVSFTGCCRPDRSTKCRHCHINLHGNGHCNRCHNLGTCRFPGCEVVVVDEVDFIHNTISSSLCRRHEVVMCWDHTILLMDGWCARCDALVQCSALGCWNLRPSRFGPHGVCLQHYHVRKRSTNK